MRTKTGRTWRFLTLASALLVTFGAGSGSAGASSGAPDPAVDRLIPAADLQADVTVLRRAYESLHPGLYRYRTRAQIDDAFTALEREFARDRSLADAYLAIARFTTFVQCGHTYPNFYNQGDEVERALLQRPRVPFEFRWVQRRMIVTRAYVDVPELKRGAEVLAIDGRPVKTLLDGLLPYSRADGSNEAKRISNLEVRGGDRYEAFDVFFPLVFPRDESHPFVLRVRSAPGARIRTLNLAAVSPERRAAGAASKSETENPWRYSEVSAGVGLLTMPTWALYDSQFAWEPYLDRLFSEMLAKGTGDLVIDLRGNEGGLSVGDRLLAHLTAADLPAEPVVRKTRYRSVPDDLRAVLKTWDRSFYDWGDAAVDLGDGFFRLTKYDTDVAGAVVKAVPPRYTGRVWVLIGPVNSSATFEFADAVQRHRLGTLVGQATGGNQRGITGGAFFFLRLPRSGIEVDVPLIGQFPMAATPLPDAGLEPDIFVQPQVADIAAARDAELAEVLRRIAATRESTLR